MALWETWRRWARRLKTEVVALGLAARDPRTPWPARLAAGLVIAYALCPLDLIPDFIPVLGYLDDLILLPLGIWLVIRLIPPQVLIDSRVRAAQGVARSGAGRWLVAAAVVLVWLAAAGVVAWWLWGFRSPRG